MWFEKVLLAGLAYVIFRLLISSRGRIKLFGMGISWRK